RGVEAHTEELRDRRPEAVQVRHRPRVQLVVRGEVPPACGAQPVDEATQLGARDAAGHARSTSGPRTFAPRPARNASIRACASALLEATAAISASMKNPSSGPVSAIRGRACSTANVVTG